MKYPIPNTPDFTRVYLPKRNSTNSYVRIYKQIMQNKPNFMRFSPENDDFTKKQSQNKPNLSQFKANSNPIKAKTNPIKANNRYSIKGVSP